MKKSKMRKYLEERKYEVKVQPPLGVLDSEALNRYMFGMEDERPGYFRQEFKFNYRGSVVTVTPKRSSAKLEKEN